MHCCAMSSIIKFVLAVIRFILVVYYLCSITFRLAFQQSVYFSQKYWLDILCDYIADVFFGTELVLAVYKYFKNAYRTPHSAYRTRKLFSTMSLATVAPDPSEKSPTAVDDYSVSALQELMYEVDSANKASVLQQSSFEGSRDEKAYIHVKKRRLYRIIWELIRVFPYEIIGYLCGYNIYPMLRVPRVAKVLDVPTYWTEVIAHLETHEILTGPSSQRVLGITTFMAVLAHLSACAFYALALGLMQNTSEQDTWLSSDGQVTFNGNDMQFTRALSYRYVRALYWSVVTEQTVGFGDVVPISIYETSYCILYFYMALMLALLSIGNLILMFNVFDSARTKYTDQTAALKKYAQFRSLPGELTDRIRSFYYHQWKILNGLDETELMKELPQNIKAKIKQSTVRKYLTNIKRLRNFRVSLLNALTEDIRIFMYSPYDVIVAVGTKARGVYIVSRGEAFIHSTSSGGGRAKGNTAEDSLEGPETVEDKSHDQAHRDDDVVEKKDFAISQALRQGEAYGVRALFDPFVFTSTLSSGACVSEILFLSRTNFRRTCRLQLNDEEFAASTQFSLIQPDPSLSQRSMRAAISGLSRGLSTKSSHVGVSSLQVEEISLWNNMMKPLSTFREWWDIMIFASLIFYSITIPLFLADALYDAFFETHMATIILGYIVDAFVAVDLILRCSCFAYMHESVSISNPRAIFNNFLTTSSIVFEISRHFPFSAFAFLLGPRFVVIFRLPKILHLGRISDYADRAERTITNLTGQTMSFTSRRFVNLYFELFLLCHWVGCLWQLVADAGPEIFGYDISWKIADRDSEFLHMVYDGGLNGFSAYRRGMYWAINGMSTAGTADMRSTNMLEMIFCSVILLGGCQTINALLGSIASLMATINMDKRRFEEKINTVRKLLRFKNIPKSLEKKIIFSYEYRFSRTSGINEVEVLDGLPQPLREACVKFVAGSVLLKIPFFANCAEPMLEMILGLLHHRLFLDGDAVVVAGEYGKDMYVIESGTIIVTSPDRQVIYASLVSGDYIGESCLLKVTQRSASAFAVDYSDTYILQKDDFQKVLDSFPTESETVVDGIKQVLADKIRRNQSKSSNQDDSQAAMPLTRIASVLNIQKRKTSTAKLDMILEKDMDKGGSTASWRKHLEEGSKFRRLWDVFLFVILMYNMIMIPLRLALDIPGVFFAIDYILDFFLLVDAYMKANMFRRSMGGRHLVEAEQIREAYIKEDVKIDLPARFPYEFFVIFVLGAPAREICDLLKMLRIPKLLLVIRGGHLLNEAEALLAELKVSFVTVRMVQVLCACVLVGHYLGCGLYLFLKVNLGDCVPEPDAMYGTACELKNTWGQFLIWNGKLAQDGGSQFSRYLRALEWSIPTMMLYVVGDVYPMNMNETSYVYGAMFFGITINAMIVGSIISLVTTLDESRSSITTQLDVLKEHLSARRVKARTIQKVIDYLKYLLTDTGQLVLKEQNVISDLPYSLEVAVNEFMKMKYFKQCKFFDFCEDSLLKRLCMRLSQANYFTGDMIVHFGDLGQEMYFVASGSVEVVSTDLNTVFAKIDKGGFFGETGLVYRSRRTANIRAAAICTCYVLTKEDFDSELQGYNTEEGAPQKALDRLAKANERMNSAVIRNLKQCSNPEFKLSKILGAVNEKQEVSIWRLLADPIGIPKLVLDCTGLFLLCYYMFTIPFEVAFLFGDHVTSYSTHVMPLDFIVDFLCIVELVLRVYFFPVGFSQLEDNSTQQVATQLYDTKLSLAYDVIASMPIEIFASIPSVSLEVIPLLRLIHLLRILNFFPRLQQVEGHLVRKGLSWHRTTLMVVKSILAYTFANHWMACMFFFVHRYERHVQLTWVIADGYATFDEETGEHDICNRAVWKCYQRAIYFTACVLTSVGYGDISPYTDGEMVSMYILAITGGALGANLAGQLMTYLQGGDKCGAAAFKEKLRSVENYIRYRGLSEDIRAMILLTYHTMWSRERRSDYGKDSFLGLLPKPMAAEVAQELNASIIDMIIVTKHMRDALHGRMALFLRPQILLPASTVYSACDTGHCVFFVLTGSVEVNIAKIEGTLDEREVNAEKVLQAKHSKLGTDHYPGTHFGEFCLLSQLGLRLDNATATEVTETYTFDKQDIWALFRSMPFVERYRFILSLFTESGGICYVENVIPTDDEEGRFDGDSVKMFYTVAGIVVEDVVEALQADTDSSEADGEKLAAVADNSDLIERRKQRRLMSVLSNFSSDMEDRMGTGNTWCTALMSFDKGKMKRRASVGISHDDLATMRNPSHNLEAPVHGNASTISTMTEVYAVMSNDCANIEEKREGILKIVKDLFLHMDKDRNGKIDKNELMLSLFDMGLEKSWNDVDDMISAADTDGDNMVSLDEMVDAIISELMNYNPSAPVRAQPRRFF